MSASNRTGDKKLSLFWLSWAAEIIWLRLSNPHNKVKYGQSHASSISYQTDLLAFSSWYNSIGDVEECWMLKVQFWTTARSDREDVWSHNLTSLALVSTLRIMNFSSRTIWYESHKCGKFHWFVSDSQKWNIVELVKNFWWEISPPKISPRSSW